MQGSKERQGREGRAAKGGCRTGLHNIFTLYRPGTIHKVLPRRFLHSLSPLADLACPLSPCPGFLYLRTYRIQPALPPSVCHYCSCHCATRGPLIHRVEYPVLVRVRNNRPIKVVSRLTPEKAANAPGARPNSREARLETRDLG